jgi:ribonuclease P protein subunit RPR2
MLRVARERISVLFALAESEAASGSLALSDRYVDLARRIGTRYNVRLMPEYRELYCRGCSRYWVEGRTVRTRFRSGRRVRTCIACGRVRRVPVRVRARAPTAVVDAVGDGPPRVPSGLASVEPDDGPEPALDDDGSEEE